MPTTAEIASAREKAGSIFDDLALQVMVNGAGALTAEVLHQLLELSAAANFSQLGAEAQSAQAQLQAKTFSDDEIKLLLARMQATLAADIAATATSQPQAAAPDTGSTTFFKDDPEIIADFVMESKEHLAAIEEKILVLEKDPTLTDTIHSVFRAFHTIKGLAGFLGLSGVQAVAHEVETLLDHARNQRIAITSEVVDLVLESSEHLKQQVAFLEARLNGQPASPVQDNAELLHTLMTATANVAAGRPLSQLSLLPPPTPVSAIERPAKIPAGAGTAELEDASQTVQPHPEPETKAKSDPAKKTDDDAETPGLHLAVPELDVITEPQDQSEKQLTSIVANPNPFPALDSPALAATPVAVPGQIASLPSTLIAGGANAGTSNPGPLNPGPANPGPANPGPDKLNRPDAVSSSVRVEVSKLDRLMDMVGELVIAQSVLSNNPRLKGDARLAGELSQLVRITSEVQRNAMSMRMMPIGPLFQKNAKMVRDLSRRNGKQVSLQLSGEATELDKTIAEELSDPLLHMIRNALDHGIEEPAERLAAGKSPVASLHIGAEHLAGQIVISISDDGRGLDPQRIREKALQKGLIDAGAQLSQNEVFQLIFAPGFSTAEKITDISGRGVGMDVVRQHVETLRGRIEIKSELGKGTKFSIYLPLTLAIIEGLTIIVGKHRYVVPVFSVREMFRPTQDMLFTVQGRDEMIMIRGDLLPLVRLHQRLQLVPRTTDICEGLLVVCEFTGKRYCLFVDDLLGRQEIVIKSLDHAFKKVMGISGSAILADGRIGLILDVAEIFRSAAAAQETAAA